MASPKYESIINKYYGKNLLNIYTVIALHCNCLTWNAVFWNEIQFQQFQ